MNNDIRHVIIGGWVAINDHQSRSISLCHQRHRGSGLDNQGGADHNEEITEWRIDDKPLVFPSLAWIGQMRW